MPESDAEVRPVANLILNAENAPLRSWGFPPLAIASRQGIRPYSQFPSFLQGALVLSICSFYSPLPDEMGFPNIPGL